MAVTVVCITSACKHDPPSAILTSAPMESRCREGGEEASRLAMGVLGTPDVYHHSAGCMADRIDWWPQILDGLEQSYLI